jgi:hypothetical protein
MVSAARVHGPGTSFDSQRSEITRRSETYEEGEKADRRTGPALSVRSSRLRPRRALARTLPRNPAEQKSRRRSRKDWSHGHKSSSSRRFRCCRDARSLSVIAPVLPRAAWVDSSVYVPRTCRPRSRPFRSPATPPPPWAPRAPQRLADTHTL